MASRRLFWHLIAPYVVVILGGFVLLTWYAQHAVRQFHYEGVDRALALSAGVLAVEGAPLLAPGDRDRLEALCRRVGDASDQRVTVILPDGEVIADTRSAPLSMENHADRPEIREAIASGSGYETRYSHTLGQNMRYHARVIRGDAGPLATVRVAYPLLRAELALQAILVRIIGGGVAVAAVAALLTVLLSRRLTRPLRTMQLASHRFASGNFDQRVPDPRIAEFQELAEAMNRMAAQLDAQIQTIQKQQAEQQAMFSSMSEGVIAAAPDGNLITMNRAAAQMLNLQREVGPGTHVGEFVRSAELLGFLDRTLASDRVLEAVVSLPGGRDLHVHGTPLAEADGVAKGALMVMHDITELRRLENVRRDFVSNVSHELKTPITLIQGFVETLREGAVKDPANAERFLGIIGRHAERLGSIIDDLLTLSRIEQDRDSGRLEAAPAVLADVAANVRDLCSQKAAEKKTEIAGPLGDLSARCEVNVAMLELALLNVVDNAVRYSPEGSRVEIRVADGDEEAVIAIEDDGPGIPEPHTDRIFERFYCVDKARSRELGGTGLGLALVKHIMAAHGGHVRMQSREGHGSCFYLHLPHEWIAGAAGQDASQAELGLTES